MVIVFVILMKAIYLNYIYSKPVDFHSLKVAGSMNECPQALHSGLRPLKGKSKNDALSIDKQPKQDYR